MRIWFISDTHCQHSGLTIPSNVDMVVHCGDEANAREPVINAGQSQVFMDWFSKLPIFFKLFVPGNHSTAIEKGLVTIPYNVIPMLGTSVRIAGIKFYGSPWTPSWGRSWAYMRKREKMHDVWQLIPDDTDVLITHSPPKGILDQTRDRDTKELLHVGCASLRKRVDVVKPRIHAFGHIHDEHGIDNFGTYSRGGTEFINCSVYSSLGKPLNEGVVKEL